MQISKILKSKSNQEIYTITSSQNIQDAITDLSARRVGVLIVSDDKERLNGVLSERDIVRELGKRGSIVLKDTVANLMTTEIKTCSSEDTAEGVLKAMTNGRFRHMPVMKNEKLIGLISIGDVVKARLAEIAEENDAMLEMIRG